ncbi:MAG: DUF4197 domain-containing protein [Thermodesulfobacteriota bacterium]|nr:DUF4197 domain-containing protein [Thermodesulfobacteriota bacterium]
MRFSRFILVVFVITLGIGKASVAQAQFGGILDSIKKVLGLKEELSAQKVSEGLKEALRVSTSNAIKAVSETGGYYQNPAIKIPLPDEIKKIENILRTAGLGQYMDTFDKVMNRAAEKAAPQAQDIFLDSITQMSFTDARKILEGRDNEATIYFRENTYNRLYDVFKPIVHSTMSQVGVIREYQELNSRLRDIPFVEELKFDLDDYVTRGSLEGLFYMVASEEKKIRQDPAARVSDLLKEVFDKK